MQLLRHRFLLAPFLLMALLFAVDKLFLLPSVQRHTILWSQIVPWFYLSRYPLYEQLLDQYDERSSAGQKAALLLGTSRSGEFSGQMLACFTPGNYIYNFSAPMAPISFYYYWLLRALEDGITPSYVIMEADPITFAPRAVDYSLAWSYDLSFIARHTHPYRRKLPKPQRWELAGELPPALTVDEAETWTLKQLFALYKFPVDPSHIRENQRSVTLPHPEKGITTMRHLDFRDSFLDTIERANRINLGGIANPLFFTVTPEALEADARQTFDYMGFQSYEPSTSQITFFYAALRELAKRDVPVVLYWPVSSQPFRNLLIESSIDNEVRSGIEDVVARVRNQYPNAHIKLVDPFKSEDLTCRAFIDSYHLSGRCYPNLTEILVQSLPEELYKLNPLCKEIKPES